MICPRCQQELVEVDNPMHREVRHRRGVVCKPVPPIPDDLFDALILPDQSPIRGHDIDLTPDWRSADG